MPDEPMISLSPDVQSYEPRDGTVLQCRACGARWTLPGVGSDSRQRRCSDCGHAQVAVVDGPGLKRFDDPARRAGGRRYRAALDEAHRERRPFVWPPSRL